MKKFLFILPAFIFLLAFGKTDSPEKEKTYTVYINYPEYTVRTNVLRDNKGVRIHPERTYYWYSNNDIKMTDGGFDGKLLHGEYKSFYRDMNLKEQGRFVNGIKEGNWVSWFRNGKIQERLHYKKGLLDGYSEFFNDKGILIRKADYREGVLHGKTIIHLNSDQDSTVIYRNGKPKPVEEKQKHKEDSAAKKNKRTIWAKDSTQKQTKSIPPAKKSAKTVKEKSKPACDTVSGKTRTDRKAKQKK